VVSKPHLIVGLVSLTSLAFVLRMVRRRQLRAKYSLLWVCVAVGMLFIAIAPGVLDRAARAMGIDYPPAVYLLIAVAFLLVVVVHFSGSCRGSRRRPARWPRSWRCCGRACLRRAMRRPERRGRR
jgi:hypothetical protein